MESNFTSMAATAQALYNNGNFDGALEILGSINSKMVFNFFVG